MDFQLSVEEVSLIVAQRLCSEGRVPAGDWSVTIHAYADAAEPGRLTHFVLSVVPKQQAQQVVN